MQREQSDKFSDDYLIEDEKFDVRNIFFRILSYWAIVLLFLVIGGFGAWLYLRYTTPVYMVKTRVVVNDETQEQNSNLFEALRVNYNNTDLATEKELEILKSKTLLTEVVRELQLNVQWTTEGRIQKLQKYGDLPIELYLESPDSISKFVTGTVKINSKNQIEFNNETFDVDTLVLSQYGKIKWVINDTLDPETSLKLSLRTISNTVDIFRDKLKTVPANKFASIVDISLNDEIPARAIQFLNTLLKQYSENNIEYKNRVSLNTLKFVDERLKLVADELGTVESQLETFRSKEGVVNLGAEGELFLSEIKEIDQKLGEIDVQQKVLNEIEQYVKNRNSLTGAPPATLGINDAVLVGLLNQLFSAEFELESLMKLSGPKNPKISVLQENIDKLRPSIITSINNLRVNLIASNNRLKSEANRFTARLKNIPQKERALLEISRQQQIKNNIYTFLLQKREEAALAAAAQVPNVRIIDKPESYGKVAPKKLKVIGVAIILAMIASAIYIYFREFNKFNILYRSEIERKTRLPLIGELVYDSDFHNENPVIVGPSRRSVIAEQFRELRTNLSFLPLQQKSRVLLLTSSIPSEGKSFIAINLAASLAQAGKKVALLEFDLRRPRISKTLEIERSPGISNYFIGQCPFEDIIKPMKQQEGVWVVPSGHIPPNPAELIMNGMLEGFMLKLREQFDYILLDSPPVGSVTDGKLLASVSDATLYVVRQDFTPKTYLNFIRALGEKNTLPSINVIFNGLNSKRVFGYTYGYGFGYEYGYGYTDQVSKKMTLRQRVRKMFNL